MPFKIRKNRNQNTYKVTNEKTGKVYAYATKQPDKLIKAIETAKHKKTYK